MRTGREPTAQEGPSRAKTAINIVVCVKYVPDATADRHFEDDNTVDRVGVDGLLSELDEYAVEEALKIVEAGGADGGGQVTVLTMGPEQATDAIKRALQMGAHAGVHVSDEAIAGSDSIATSLVLAKAVQKISESGVVDLVLTGLPQRIQEGEVSAAVLLVSAKLATALILAAALTG